MGLGSEPGFDAAGSIIQDSFSPDEHAVRMLIRTTTPAIVSSPQERSSWSEYLEILDLEPSDTVEVRAGNTTAREFAEAEARLQQRARELLQEQLLEEQRLQASQADEASDYESPWEL